MNDNPIARNKDPETSHTAAAYMDQSGKRQTQTTLAAALVAQYPGRTYSELHANHAHICNKFGIVDVFKTPEGLMKRLHDAKNKNLIMKADHRPCRCTGQLAAVWHPV